MRFTILLQIMEYPEISLNQTICLSLQAAVLNHAESICLVTVLGDGAVDNAFGTMILELQFCE